MSDAPELLLANHLKTLRLPTFQRDWTCRGLVPPQVLV